MENSLISDSQIKVVIYGSNEPYSISYTISFTGIRELTISIIYYSMLINDNSEFVVISMIEPYEIRSTIGVPMAQEKTFTADFQGEVQVSTSEESVGAGAQFGLTSTVAIAMGSSVLLGSSMEAMWSLVNTCQLLFFLGLVSVYYPQNILNFFTYLGMANVNNVFLAMLTQRLIVGDHQDHRQPINYRYNEMGYQKISILENISDLVALALLMIIGTIFVVLISLLKWLKTLRFIGTLMRKLQKMFMFNAIFRLLLEG